MDAAFLKNWAEDTGKIKEVVSELIMQELKTVEVTGRNLIFANVICKYAVQILNRDCELLQEFGKDHFKILSLEVEDIVTICGRPFKGFIDRLDTLEDGTVRVADYKTGGVLDSEIDITDNGAVALAEQLFSPDSKKRPKIALQLYVYDKIVREKYHDARIYNSLYPVVRLFKEPVPVVECSQAFMEEVDRRLEDTFRDIFNPEIGFSRTSNEMVCEYCDFKMLCGK